MAARHISDRADDFLAHLKPEIAHDYRDAVVRLGKDYRLTDPEFEAAVSVAINFCQKVRNQAPARSSDGHVRSWGAVSSAARKLNASLRASGEHAAYIRLIHASSKSGFDLGIKQQARLPAFFDALANQIPKIGTKSSYRVGPLRVEKGGHKRMTQVNAFIIGLAYVFERSSKNNFKVFPGARITSGLAWDAAADFAQVAFGSIADAGPAKKALSDHKGRVVYMGL